MANEFTIQIGFNFNKNSTRLRFDNTNFQYTISGNNSVDNIQAVTTSAVNVYIGAASTGHWCFAQNLDGTHYVELGEDSGGFVAWTKLNPGEISLFRVSGTKVLQAKANTSTCNCRFIIIPN